MAESTRRKMGYWDPFNNWWREFVAQHDKRPKVHDMKRWYETNAERVWGGNGPTWEETKKHSKGMRRIEDISDYFRKYRRGRKKKIGGSADSYSSGSESEEEEACMPSTAKQSRARTKSARKTPAASGAANLLQFKANGAPDIIMPQLQLPSSDAAGQGPVSLVQQLLADDGPQIPIAPVQQPSMNNPHPMPGPEMQSCATASAHQIPLPPVQQPHGDSGPSYASMQQPRADNAPYHLLQQQPSMQQHRTDSGPFPPMQHARTDSGPYHPMQHAPMHTSQTESGTYPPICHQPMQQMRPDGGPFQPMPQPVQQLRTDSSAFPQAQRHPLKQQSRAESDPFQPSQHVPLPQLRSESVSYPPRQPLPMQQPHPDGGPYPPRQHAAMQQQLRPDSAPFPQPQPQRRVVGPFPAMQQWNFFSPMQLQRRVTSGPFPPAQHQQLHQQQMHQQQQMRHQQQEHTHQQQHQHQHPHQHRAGSAPQVPHAAPNTPFFRLPYTGWPMSGWRMRSASMPSIPAQHHPTVPLPQPQELQQHVPLPQPQELQQHVPLPQPQELQQNVPLPQAQELQQHMPLPQPQELQQHVPLPQPQELQQQQQEPQQQQQRVPPPAIAPPPQQMSYPMSPDAVAVACPPAVPYARSAPPPAPPGAFPPNPFRTNKRILSLPRHSVTEMEIDPHPHHLLDAARPIAALQPPPALRRPYPPTGPYLASLQEEGPAVAAEVLQGAQGIMGGSAAGAGGSSATVGGGDQVHGDAGGSSPAVTSTPVLEPQAAVAPPADAHGPPERGVLGMLYTRSSTLRRVHILFNRWAYADTDHDLEAPDTAAPAPSPATAALGSPDPSPPNPFRQLQRLGSMSGSWLLGKRSREADSPGVTSSPGRKLQRGISGVFRPLVDTFASFGRRGCNSASAAAAAAAVAEVDAEAAAAAAAAAAAMECPGPAAGVGKDMLYTAAADGDLLVVDSGMLAELQEGVSGDGDMPEAQPLAAADGSSPSSSQHQQLVLLQNAEQQARTLSTGPDLQGPRTTPYLEPSPVQPQSVTAAAHYTVPRTGPVITTGVIGPGGRPAHPPLTRLHHSHVPPRPQQQPLQMPQQLQPQQLQQQQQQPLQLQQQQQPLQMQQQLQPQQQQPLQLQQQQQLRQQQLQQQQMPYGGYGLQQEQHYLPPASSVWPHQPQEQQQQQLLPHQDGLLQQQPPQQQQLQDDGSAGGGLLLRLSNSLTEYWKQLAWGR